MVQVLCGKKVNKPVTNFSALAVYLPVRVGKGSFAFSIWEETPFEDWKVMGNNGIK